MRAARYAISADAGDHEDLEPRDDPPPGGPLSLISLIFILGAPGGGPLGVEPTFPDVRKDYNQLNYHINRPCAPARPISRIGCGFQKFRVTTTAAWTAALIRRRITIYLLDNGHRSRTTKLTGRPPHPGQNEGGKSRLSNGHGVLLDKVDGRSAMYRRYRDICGAIIADSGGISACSESRQHLIRRFAAAAVLAEQMESKIVNGEPVDITEFAQLSSTLVAIRN